MSSNILRVRFAPSPTGNPHVGNFRTALFNYLLARHHGGQFLLRIEDTDRERSRKEYEEAILESLRWMGLEWDEDPVYQSRRIERHKEEAERLLANGFAYRCRCTPERIEALRKRQQEEGQTARYDGCCRDADYLDDGTPFCVRLKRPLEGVTKIQDAVRGEVVVSNEELDDLVLVRTDGTPTYNFAVVVDDHDMKITHVIRGDDHLNNTIKQAVLYQSLGYELPVFAHLPQILGQDRTRLSKRHGATGVMEYRDQGYLSEALVNYMARLGWSKGDQEFFQKSDLIEAFSLDHVNKSAAVFDPQKLEWLNGEHIRAMDPDALAERFSDYGKRKGYLGENADAFLADKNLIRKIVQCTQIRAKTLEEMFQKVSFLFEKGDYQFNEAEAKKTFKPEPMTAVKDFADFIHDHQQETFTHDDWEKIFGEIMEKRGVKMRPLASAVRLALTGLKVTPPIFDVIDLLGLERVERHLRYAIQYAEAMRDE